MEKNSTKVKQNKLFQKISATQSSHIQTINQNQHVKPTTYNIVKLFMACLYQK